MNFNCKECPYRILKDANGNGVCSQCNHQDHEAKEAIRELTDALIDAGGEWDKYVSDCFWNI